MPRLRLLAVAVAVLFALPTFSQDVESVAGLRLRFDAPGARAAAMGGASEASSDAFSVATNPASLVHQNDRAVAVEARQTTDETDFLTGGTVGSFTSSSFDTTSRGLRSAVVVLPGHRATWALYYDEPLNLSRDTRFLIPATPSMIAVGVRGNEVVPADSCINPNGPSDCQFIAHYSAPAVVPIWADVRLRRYGLAVARRWGGRVAAGGSLQYARMQEVVHALAGFEQNVDDARFTWNAGTQIDVTSRLRFGASYRGGARFGADRTLTLIDGVRRTIAHTFATPSSFAAGLAAQVTPNFTVAVDAVRVRYSEMTRVREFDLTPPPDSYRMPDVTELRAGAEYRLRTRVPVALRAGWWHEPAHRVQASGGIFPGTAVVTNEILLRDRDENHVTAGIGIGSRVRFDAAIDRSENTSRASVAVATTF